NRADVRPDVHPRRVIHAPRGRQEVAVQSAGDNDKAFKPHAGVNAHGDEEDDQHVAAAPAEPKKLWRKHVAKEHAEPTVPPVGTENAIAKREPHVMIGAIPSKEESNRLALTE